MSDLNNIVTNNKKEVSLLGLFGKEKLEDLQKKIAGATDFSFSIVDFKGDEVIDGVVLNNYCENKKSTGACQNCKMACAFSAAKAAFTNNPYLFECEQGLVAAAIPVIVNNQYLGAVLCGRVRCSDKENLPDAVAGAASKTIHEENNPSLAKAYEIISEFDCQKIRAVSSLVHDYFQELCAKETYAILLADYEHKEVHLKDLRKKNSSLRKHMEDANMKALRASLLPQLLLNMFVTVSNYAILEEATQTERVLEEMSSILRYYTEYDKNRIRLSQEIKQVENYMNILSGCYENRLKCHIQYKNETEKQMIPKLSLLPLVQYVADFGILSNHSKGTFHLDTTFSSDRCVISIQFEKTENDMQMMGYLKHSGNIMDETAMRNQLEDVKKRLDYEYKGDYSMKIQKDMIVLNIPRTSESEEVSQ